MDKITGVFIIDHISDDTLKQPPTISIWRSTSRDYRYSKERVRRLEALLGKGKIEPVRLNIPPYEWRVRARCYFWPIPFTYYSHGVQNA